MNLETALDETTEVSLAAAVYCLEEHGHTVFHSRNTLMVMADNPIDMAYTVCDIKNGMVKTLEVMKFLGY